jgi:hypothetical protein
VTERLKSSGKFREKEFGNSKEFWSRQGGWDGRIFKWRDYRKVKLAKVFSSRNYDSELMNQKNSSSQTCRLQQTLITLRCSKQLPGRKFNMKALKKLKVWLDSEVTFTTRPKLFHSV